MINIIEVNSEHPFTDLVPSIKLLILFEAAHRAAIESINNHRVDSYLYILGEKGMLPISSYIFRWELGPLSYRLHEDLIGLNTLGYLTGATQGKYSITLGGREFLKRHITDEAEPTLKIIVEELQEIHHLSDQMLFSKCFNIETRLLGLGYIGKTLLLFEVAQRACWGAIDVDRVGPYLYLIERWRILPSGYHFEWKPWPESDELNRDLSIQRENRRLAFENQGDDNVYYRITDEGRIFMEHRITDELKPTLDMIVQRIQKMQGWDFKILLRECYREKVKHMEVTHP